MYPVLLHFGPVTLHTYGLLVALGVGLGGFLAWRHARAVGVDPEKFLDLVFWMLVGGILGARLGYVVVTWREFAHDLLGIVRIWDGGLVFYGGFAGACLATWLFARRQNQPLMPWLDLAAPYAALAHAFGRIGCFFSGCCYGLPSQVGGVVFPALGDSVPRLPTQLWESGFNLALFGMLLWLRPRWRHAGQLFWAYVGFYALGRFVLEYFRGDEIRGVWFFPWLHTSQAIALLAFGLAVVFWIRAGRTRA